MLAVVALPLLLLAPPDTLARVAGAVPAPDSVRWAAKGELSYTNVAGNTELSLLTTGLELDRDGPDYELELGGIARYGRSDGDVSVENYAAGARVRFLPAGTLSPYLAVNYTRDPVKNLRVRWAARAGVEANLLRGEADRHLALGLALLRDYESRLLPPGSTDPARIERTRFNLSFNLLLPLREGVTLENRSMFEPATRDLADYLVVSRTNLRLALTRVIGFQTSFTFERDNTPPPGVERKNDRTLSVGILLSLK